MTQRTCWTSLVVLAVFLCHLHSSAACICYVHHLQTHFCDSDFVFLVNVTNEPSKSNARKFADEKTYVAYTVDVIEILRSKPAAVSVVQNKSLSIWTPTEDCNLVGPKQGSEWLIGGTVRENKLHINQCNLAILWSELNDHRQSLIREKYEDGCDCYITHHQWASIYKDTCVQVPYPKKVKNCMKLYGYCIKVERECLWDRYSGYNECLSSPEENGEYIIGQIN